MFHSNLLQMGSVTVMGSETVDVLVMHSLSGLSTDCVFNSFRRRLSGYGQESSFPL